MRIRWSSGLGILAIIIGLLAIGMSPTTCHSDAAGYFIPSASQILQGHWETVYAIGATVHHANVTPPLGEMLFLPAALIGLADPASCSGLSLLAAHLAGLVCAVIWVNILAHWRRTTPVSVLLALVLISPPIIAAAITYGHAELLFAGMAGALAGWKLEQGKPVQATIWGTVAALSKLTAIGYVLAILLIIGRRHSKKLGKSVASSLAMSGLVLAPFVITAPQRVWYALAQFHAEASIRAFSLWAFAPAASRLDTVVVLAGVAGLTIRALQKEWGIPLLWWSIDLWVMLSLKEWFPYYGAPLAIWSLWLLMQQPVTLRRRVVTGMILIIIWSGMDQAFLHGTSWPATLQTGALLMSVLATIMLVQPWAYPSTRSAISRIGDTSS